MLLAALELVSSQKRKPEKADPNRKVWVIGVDKDQYDEGKVPGTKQSVTLTSMVKKVDTAVQDLTTKAKEGKFPGGEVITYGLKEGALDISI